MADIPPYRPYSPQELPDVRLRMVEFLDTTDGRNWAHLVFADEAGQELTSAQLDEHIRAVRASITDSELFYLDSHITSITQNKPLPISDYGFMPWDLPAPVGFAYFDASDINLDAEFARKSLVLTWIADEPREGAPEGLLYVFVHEAVRDIVAQGLPEDYIATNSNVPDFVFSDLLSVKFAHERGGVRAFTNGGESSTRFATLLLAASHLMRQQLAVSASEPVSRQVRRRHQRSGLEPPEVRTVRLQQSARPESTGESQREWHHRWVVRGFWRNQWYPSLQAHRPKWIAPYVKGPQDAPLLGGEKVYTATDPNRGES